MSKKSRHFFFASPTHVGECPVSVGVGYVSDIVRPVVGRRGTLKDPGQSSKFFGHLIIDKVRFRKQRDEMRTAVSTSHYSQSNTIEYEMAIEWRALEEKSEKWWEALNEASANTMGFDLLACSLKVSLNYKISLPSSQIKQQAKEIEDLSSKLKMRHYK